MDSLLSAGVIQWAAIVIIVSALLHAFLSFYNSLRATRMMRQQHEVSLDLLRRQVERETLHVQLERDKTVNTWSGLRKFRISQKTPEGGGICSFYMEPHDGKPLPPFEPGQYLTFQLKLPDRDKPLIRCYSLSDSPLQRDHYRVSIKRLDPPPKAPDAPPGKSSNFFHRQLNEGDILDVKAPGGNFYLDQTQHTPVVLIGGGVGITPVLSMLGAICDSGSKRETWFFYGVRHGDEHVMRDYLAEADAAHENVHLRVCYSNPRDGEDVEGRDYHHSERVGVELFKRVLPSNNFDFYICGPPPMMESLVKDLGEWGVPESRINFEAFGPASVKKKKPAAAAQADAGSDAGIEVIFAKSGKTLKWSAEAGSLLDLAEANDIELDFGCRAGSCGTCATAVRSGEVDYLDSPSASLDDGSCLACIAVPKSQLTIDA